jgi:hypothetical protein
MEELSSQWIDFHEVLYLIMFQKSIEKIQASLISDKITDTLHENQYAFLIIYRSVLLRMRNVGEKLRKANENTYFMFNNFFLNSAIYEITWKNMVQPGRPQTTIWRTRIACRILKATDTHSEYLMLLDFLL